MRRLCLILTLSVLSLWAEPIDRTGPYIAAGGGYTAFYDDGRLGEGKIDNSYDLLLVGGAFINKYLSVEMTVDYFDTFGSQVHKNTTSVYMIEASAKAHYPFWKERIDLYAAFGAGGIFWKENIEGNTQKDNSGVTSGDLGVGFRIMRELTINLGYRRYFFTVQQNAGYDAEGNINYERYHMQTGSLYSTIEVQF